MRGELVVVEGEASGRLWRSRWAALGAALAVAVAGGGLYAVNASGSASSFVPVSPTRVLDTRVDLGLAGRFVGGVARLLDVTGVVAVATGGTAVVVPDGATAVVLNVTVVAPTDAGFVSIRPGDAVGDPSTSNLNFSAGAVIPNGVTVQLPTGGGAAGLLNIYFFGNSPGATVDLLVDVVGYYQTGATGPQGAPGATGAAGPVNRISDTQINSLRWDQDPGRSATITVGTSPSGVASDGTHMWVTNGGADTVSKINPTTNAVVGTVPVGDNPTGVAFDGTSIWVTNRDAGTVSKINPVTAAVTATVTVGSAPVGVAFDGSNIWVTNSGVGSVSKINPTTNAVIATVALSGGGSPTGIAFDGTSMWVARQDLNNVVKINVTTNVATAGPTVGLAPLGVAFDGTSIWVANSGVGTVSKINPLTNVVIGSPITVGARPVALAYDGTNLWVVNNLDDTLSKINPTTGTVVLPNVAITDPLAIAFDGSNLWVTTFSNTVVKFIPF